MTERLELTPNTGPIRSCGSVKVRALTAPVTIRVRGTPGPTGPQGVKGDTGAQGPTGTLDAGIVIDGGNF